MEEEGSRREGEGKRAFKEDLGVREGGRAMKGEGKEEGERRREEEGGE